MTGVETLAPREDRDGIALIAPPFNRRAPPGAKFEDVQHLVAGPRGRDALAAGNADGGIWSAGLIQGLIHDIPTVKDLMDRIIADEGS
jgi:NAD(P)H-dependent flavin oxidoreductase YrpB (nitropropane dioxygenase family)